MMHQWTRPKSGTPIMMPQCTGCVRASVQCVPPSVQKTGMPLPGHFFVHSTPVTRINTSPLGVYTPVHCHTQCTHLCVQGVYGRVYSLFPSNTHRKGVCA